MVCEFHDSNCNGFGDMWWTDKCIDFSSIDVDMPILSLISRHISNQALNRGPLWWEQLPP